MPLGCGRPTIDAPTWPEAGGILVRFLVGCTTHDLTVIVYRDRRAYVSAKGAEVLDVVTALPQDRVVCGIVSQGVVLASL